MACFFFFLFLTLSFATNDVIVLHEMLNETVCKAMVEKAQSLYVVKIGLEPTWQAEDQLLFEVFSKGISELKARYYEFYAPNITQDSGYQLFGMDEGNKTILYASEIGQVTSVLFLNDNVAGGEWVFPRQGNFTVAPECGKMVLFPSSYTHPHTIKRIRLGRELFVVSFFF